MKVKYITTALFFGVITTIEAQDNTIQKSNAGIKGGYNLAAVSFDGDGETDQRQKMCF